MLTTLFLAPEGLEAPTGGLSRRLTCKRAPARMTRIGDGIDSHVQNLNYYSTPREVEDLWNF